jgi:hypothetical protein
MNGDIGISFGQIRIVPVKAAHLCPVGSHEINETIDEAIEAELFEIRRKHGAHLKGMPYCKAVVTFLRLRGYFRKLSAFRARSFAAEFGHFNADGPGVDLDQEIRSLMRHRHAGWKQGRRPPRLFQVDGLVTFLFVLRNSHNIFILRRLANLGQSPISPNMPPGNTALNPADNRTMLVQRYVSTDLTHFVGAKLKAQRDQYRLLKSILKSCTLKASPGPVTTPQYLLVRKTHLPLSSNEACLGSVVCFCDIPLCDLPLHMSKYSQFGLAFTKDYLAESGALPVIYVPVRGRPALLPYEDYGRKRVASQAVGFNEFWRLFQRIEEAVPAIEKAELPEAARDLRRMMRFLECNIVSNFKFFDHRLDDTEDEHYYMEREWRVSQNVTFTLGDVTRIIIPESYGGQFRRDFPNFDGEVVFADWEH